jgi:hypothetical protein
MKSIFAWFAQGIGQPPPYCRQHVQYMGYVMDRPVTVVIIESSNISSKMRTMFSPGQTLSYGPVTRSSSLAWTSWTRSDKHLDVVVFMDMTGSPFVTHFS